MCDDGPKRDDILLKAGWVLTITYLVALLIGIPVLRDLGLFGDEKLQLNTLGDFLAGIFSPLAFLWLVLGFYQQKRELSLQIAEMAQATKQFEEQTITAQQTLLYEREKQELERRDRAERIQPEFQFFYTHENCPNGLIQLVMRNYGHSVPTMSIDRIFHHGEDPNPLYQEFFELGGGTHLIEHFEEGIADLSDAYFLIRYRDEDGKYHTEKHCFPTKNASHLNQYWTFQIEKDGLLDSKLEEELALGKFWEK